ncbi:hypothetical protein [Nonomuraea sp. NPDC023979]|uniref:hypothetical protein n=1 Tax=Nonomuraea sp. NPDC023979 TaxID=3154796 RepID=UPI0033ED0F2B
MSKPVSVELSAEERDLLIAAATHIDGLFPALDPRIRILFLARGYAAANIDWREQPCPQLGGILTLTPVTTSLRITGLGRAVASAHQVAARSRCHA